MKVNKELHLFVIYYSKSNRVYQNHFTCKIKYVWLYPTGFLFTNSKITLLKCLLIATQKNKMSLIYSFICLSETFTSAWWVHQKRVVWMKCGTKTNYHKLFCANINIFILTKEDVCTPQVYSWVWLFIMTRVCNNPFHHRDIITLIP